MNEDALRALVRDTIARLESRPQGAPDADTLLHVSAQACNYKYNLAPADDRCVIEPGVACNHCGYCLSHGH